MYKNLNLTIFLALLFVIPSLAQDDAILRYPSLSPDGTQISFSYQGDIWISPTNGGVARRLTIHESYESKPQWSPDGTQILFQGSRLGNNDLFVVDVNGSTPRRLTYHSSGDGDAQWGSDGKIYFSTRRAFQQVEREQEIYSISKNGGTPQRALDAVGLMPSPSPDGNYLAFVRGTCRIEREAYTGPANRDIWIYSKNNNAYSKFTNLNSQEIYPNWGGDKVYYLSAKTGRYNIYSKSVDADGKATGVALTDFKDEGIRYFDVSNDGSTIVFEKGTKIYSMKTSGNAKPQLVNVEVAKDYRFDPIEHKTYSSSASDYAISPNEKQIAFVVHGELFVKLNNKEKKRSVQLTDHPYRDKEPVWLNDSTLLFISDRDGKFDLYALQSSDMKEGDLYKSFKRKVTRLTNNAADEERMVISPDRKKIAYLRGRGILVVADISSNGNLSNEKKLAEGWATPSGVSWSPDSKWLAYASDDLDFNREIYIHQADGNKQPVNVSLHPRRDSSPKWSRDGSKLGFLSTRNNGDTDVWFVWLKKEDWEKTKDDWEDATDDEPATGKGKGGDKKKKDKKVKPVQIDFEDIHERIEQVTRIAGNEGNLMISKDGESFYFTTNGGGRQGSPGPANLMSVNWNGEKLKKMAEKININNLKLSKDGKKLYGIKRGGSMVNLNVKDGKQTSLGFQAKMDINHKEEREQVFNEGWRRLRDGFYDPNFHGKDWKQLRDHYYDRCMNASTKQDFQYFYNEMLGQLNASHMGLRGGGTPEETQRERTGLLGIEVESHAQGVKIKTIIPNTPADRKESKIKVGDIIRAVDGTNVNANTNLYALLNGKVNERILLEVSNSGGAQREVIIRPTSSIRGQLYTAWVKERKRLTDKYSNGKLGYIHIQGMNWTSFERFERELTASGLGKEGMVIDVRFNGGGWTTDMLMTVLNVRQHSYTIPRGAAKDLDKEHLKFKETYPFGERLPFSSWTKPSIAMCNENSYSNAEIFSHAYKHLDIGTLVGRPTFGAVISTGGSGLLDGSFVRMPYRGWYVKATEKNMEWEPAVPDIEVQNQPGEKANGSDTQLKAAVEQLLKEINE